MKILHVINGLWPGGAQVMLLRLCEELGRHEVQNEVFSLTKNDTIKPQLEAIGVTCHSGNLLDLRRVLAKSSPSAVQGWMYHSNLAVSISSLFTNLAGKGFWSVHHTIDDISREKFTTRSVIRLLRAMSKMPQKTVYVSQVSQQQHEALGYNPLNSVLIPNGYDLEMFKKDPALRQAFRDELGVSDELFMIGILGRFHEMKDHQTFLDAAALFAAKHEKFGIVIAGRDTNNAQISEWISERGLTEKVHLLGDRRDVSAILNGLDILASSSRFGEAFPIVIGEAMSCETICCSTDVGDSRWLIGNDDLICPPGEPQSLANNWLSVASLSREDREKLGKTMRERIEEKYSLASIADKYLSLYKECV